MCQGGVEESLPITQTIMGEEDGVALVTSETALLLHTLANALCVEVDDAHSREALQRVQMIHRLVWDILHR